MAAEKNGLATEKEVIDAIQKMAREGDRDKMTNRTVTNDIVKMFGERLGPIQEKIKGVVRRELNAYLESEAAANEGGTAEEKPSEVIKDVQSSGKVTENSNTKSQPAIGSTNADIPVVPAGNGSPGNMQVEKNENTTEDASEANEKENKILVTEKVEKDVPEKEGKVANAQVIDDEVTEKDGEPGDEEEEEDADSKEDKDDSDFKAEEEEEEAPVQKKRGRGRPKNSEVEEEDKEGGSEVTKKRARGRPKKVKAKPESDEESEESESEGEKEPRKRRKKSRASRKTKQELTSVEKQLKRYLKLCRDLGCNFPPIRFRGITDTKEKRDIVVQYLGEKGVDITKDNLTQSNVRMLRKKFADEKELAALDTANIIQSGDEGRPKRRRASTGVSYRDKTEKEELEEEEVDEKINNNQGDEAQENTTTTTNNNNNKPPPEPESENGEGSESEGYVAEASLSDDDDDMVDED